MKKILILTLLSTLFLTGCGSKESVDYTSDNNELTRLETFDDSNFIQHIDYSTFWSSTSSPDYNSSTFGYVYKTNLKITIKLLKTGFVTYDGTAEANFTFEWRYYDDSYNTYTNQTSVVMPLTFSDTNITCTFEKTFEVKSQGTGYFDPSSEIPYCPTPATSPMSIKSLTLSNTNVRATYYNNGVSGTNSLRYETFEITTANYQNYLKAEYDLPSFDKRLYIVPIKTNDLYDYRISLVIGGREIVLSRDGYLRTWESLQDTTISSVKGFIDVYPGRVI